MALGMLGCYPETLLLMGSWKGHFKLSSCALASCSAPMFLGDCACCLHAVQVRRDVCALRDGPHLREHEAALHVRQGVPHVPHGHRESDLHLPGPGLRAKVRLIRASRVTFPVFFKQTQSS